MGLAYTSDGVQVYEPDGEVLERFLWDRSEFSCIQGPIGSGTSTACCHRIFMQACEQLPDYDGVRRTKWLVVRDSYPKLEKTTARTWLDWFPEDIFGEFRWSKPPTHRVECSHPSGDGTVVDLELIFIAIESAEVAEEVAASFEITGFWVNEAQFTDKAVIDELLSRCGRYPSVKNGPGATWFGGFADMNAPTEGHWVPYMRGDLPFPKEWTEEMRAEFYAPEGWRFFVQPPGLIETTVNGKVSYRPNPAAENQKNLKKTYMQQIAGKSKEWIDRRVMNKTGLYSAGKPVYPTFVSGEHVSQWDLNPLSNSVIFVGLDFGRDPAAVFGQCVSGSWRVLSELIGNNESAELFAPRVRQFLQQEYPGYRFEIGGDPRGGDRGQNVEITAYDIFSQHGLRVMEASTDNSPELRRSTVEKVLSRRNGLVVSPSCRTLTNGMAGGYHYPKIKGHSGMYAPRPLKNHFSHVVEAFENMLLIGGEGDQVVFGGDERGVPVPIRRRRYRHR